MFQAIKQVNSDIFSIVWDLGRRCTFSCSYCGPHHSNKWSPNTDLDTLKLTLDGVARYTSLLNRYRKIPKRTSLAFTGGEPTANPYFFEFLEYAKNKYPSVAINVTTNGCYSERKCKQIMENADSCTISYHAEATATEKELVKQGILLMVASKFNFRVNLMFHKDYFDECVKVASWLDSLNVKYTPRVIGDSNNIEDIKDGTAHVYTEDQLQWFKSYWKEKNQAVNNEARSCEVATKIGRPCCANKKLNLLIDDEWQPGSFVPDNNFKGWNCMINWYFLFINSELDGVWHHQTCQVNLDGKIGPIGKASDFESIINNLELQLKNNTINYIKCPKTYCGCGLCASKAKDNTVALDIFKSSINTLEPIFQNDVKELDKSNSIIGILKQRDKLLK